MAEIGTNRAGTMLKLTTLLVFGDADAVRTDHAVQCFQLLGGGMKDGGWDGSGVSSARLAILPGTQSLQHPLHQSWLRR